MERREIVMLCCIVLLVASNVFFAVQYYSLQERLRAAEPMYELSTQLANNYRHMVSESTGWSADNVFLTHDGRGYSPIFVTNLLQAPMNISFSLTSESGDQINLRYIPQTSLLPNDTQGFTVAILNNGTKMNATLAVFSNNVLYRNKTIHILDYEPSN